MKKIISILLVVCVVLTTTVFSASAMTKTNNGELSNITIGIVGYLDSGTAYNAYKAFYNEVSKATGIKFKYVKGNSYDESANVTAVQNLISSGVNGIIMCMDSAMPSIVNEAQSAGVYVAGFLTGFDKSINTIKNNKYFLGTVRDGYADGSILGNKIADLVIKNKNKNVGVITFPKIYFPVHGQADKAFRAKITQYNDKSAAKDKITMYDTEELSFKPLDPTYFKKYPKLDAIVGLSSGFVYPTMVSANVKNVTLYSNGYDNTASFKNAFKKGIVRMQTCSNVEAMIYPISLIVNAIKGIQFADKPTSEAVDTNTVFITNPYDENIFENEAIYYTGNAKHSLLSEDDIRSLIKATNPNATYKNLVKTIQSWTIEDLTAKSKSKSKSK